MIVPTVGRMVWYFIGAKIRPQQQPFAAIITYVHNDKLINIAYFDESGQANKNTSVPLKQSDSEEFNGPYCTWMPYQLGQAAKTETTEATLKDVLQPKADKPHTKIAPTPIKSDAK